ncbi:MAG: GAF domain-containing protein [Gaiellaceae bacterium]
MSRTPDFILGDEFAKVLTETTMSLVCVLDHDARILFFNDACERVTGFARDEVVGGDARDFVIPPEEAEAFSEVINYIWSTGLSSPQVGHWLTKDGQRKLIAWSNRLMPSEDGGPALLVTAGLDLSASTPSGADEGAFEGDPDAKLAEVGRLAQEQRALRRVATLVASEASPERVFTAVSEECARVLEVNASAVFRYEGDDTATIVGRHSRVGAAGDAFTLGMRLPAGEDTGIGQVLRTGAPARIHDYTERPGEIAENMRLMSYRSSVSAPIVVAGILWGAVGIASAEPLPADTEARLGAFCELVSLAVASAQARADLSASRARLVKAGDEQRRRLERNLHDGAQQRLVSLALTIRLARRQLESSSEAAAASLEGAAKELDLALAELRELARGLHPAALTEQGLGPALTGVATRLPIDVDVSAPSQRLPENIEATAYYIVSEALTNVVKHAQATKAKVDMTLAGDMLNFEITDDGRGGADPAAGSGILGLRDRAEAVGGTLFVISPPGKGTVVTAHLPLSGA